MGHLFVTFLQIIVFCVGFLRAGHLEYYVISNEEYEEIYNEIVPVIMDPDQMGRETDKLVQFLESRRIVRTELSELVEVPVFSQSDRLSEFPLSNLEEMGRSDEDTKNTKDINDDINDDLKDINEDITHTKWEVCSICLEAVRKNIVQLECVHVFHMECIEEWILEKSAEPDCPICRQRIVIEEKQPPQQTPAQISRGYSPATRLHYRLKAVSLTVFSKYCLYALKGMRARGVVANFIWVLGLLYVATVTPSHPVALLSTMLILLIIFQVLSITLIYYILPLSLQPFYILGVIHRYHLNPIVLIQTIYECSILSIFIVYYLILYSPHTHIHRREVSNFILRVIIIIKMGLFDICGEGALAHILMIFLCAIYDIFIILPVTIYYMIVKRSKSFSKVLLVY